MEEVERWITWAASHGALLALVVGSFAGWTLTLALERYFLPNAQEPDTRRRQRGLTFVFCWLACGTCMALMWWALDSTTAAGVRLVVSYVTGALPFTLYPILARLATDKFPAIGTAWIKDEEH